jgi:hypothetical protein
MKLSTEWPAGHSPIKLSTNVLSLSLCRSLYPPDAADSKRDLTSSMSTVAFSNPMASGTANCIIIDHSSAFESGLVARFSTLRDKKRLGSSQNGLKFEHRRVSKPFLRFSS